jgi:hypothetical protein
LGTSTVVNLTIRGGTIQAAGRYGAAIGSGYGYQGTSSVTNIKVIDGNINTTSSFSAGIGSGQGYDGNSRVSDLTILTAKITAQSLNGPGIGAGWGYNGESSVGNITIVNSNINANGSGGAGIGTGPAFSGNTTVDTLAIIGGNITVAATNAAAIGTGAAYTRGRSSIGNLTIADAVISAVVVNGSGIGVGLASNGTGAVSSVSLVNVAVTVSSQYGAGVGTGRAIQLGNASVLAVTIVDSRVNAGSSHGAALGAGYASGIGNSSVGSLTISGSFVNAVGTHGAGIGGGEVEQSGVATVQHLLLVGGDVTATSLGAAAIGSGTRDRVSVALSGSIQLRVSTSGDGPIDGYPLVLDGSSITATTESAPLFGSTPSPADDVSLTILYESETAKGEELIGDLGGYFLQIGNLSLPVESIWNLRIWNIGYSKSIVLDSLAIVSFISSVPANGSYEIAASTESLSGRLQTPSGESVFVVNSPVSFVPLVVFSPDLPTTSPGLSNGAIAGIVVGSVVFVGILVAGVVILVRRRKIIKKNAKETEGATHALLGNSRGVQEYGQIL